MSESDIRVVINRYNDSLNKYSLEKMEIEKKIASIIEKIDDKN
jgi:hypothetical protein